MMDMGVWGGGMQSTLMRPTAGQLGPMGFLERTNPFAV